MVKQLSAKKRRLGRTESEQLGDQARMLLLPEPVVETEYCTLMSYVKNAAQYGGDWWGWSQVNRAKKKPLLLLMIGDATGHGAPAALVAATIKGALSVLSIWMQNNAELAADPREILKILNRVVYDAARGAIVMTMNVVVFDPDAKTVKSANAGHNFPYVLSPVEGGGIEINALGEGGIPLGHALDTEFQDLETHQWIKGSKVFLYTDGLTECYSGDINLFDRRQLQKILRKNGTLPAGDLRSTVVGARDAATQGLVQADDITVVVCEIKE